MIRMSLLILALMLLFHSCQESSSNEWQADSESENFLSIEGQRIWAVYDHNGPPPIIDVAMFTIANRSDQSLYLQGISLEHVEGDLDSLGNIVITEAKSLDSLHCRKCFFENQGIGANRLKHMQLYFDPIQVEISYQHNYQAIRLKMNYGGDTIFSDAILDVEREEPFEPT